MDGVCILSKIFVYVYRSLLQLPHFTLFLCDKFEFLSANNVKRVPFRSDFARQTVFILGYMFRSNIFSRVQRERVSTIFLHGFSFRLVLFVFADFFLAVTDN